MTVSISDCIAHLVVPDHGETIEVLGPTFRRHSHPEPETFQILAGAVAALVVTEDGKGGRRCDLRR